ncbi:MAG TPA: DUF6298 domain-containing protein [Nitrospira sp.]|nr:DUF6298 domain-containing protein [Nitrospira sp.]
MLSESPHHSKLQVLQLLRQVSMNGSASKTRVGLWPKRLLTGLIGVCLIALVIVVSLFFIFQSDSSQAQFVSGRDVMSSTLLIPQASGPLTVHPENSRYFADTSGRAVYLTGSHHWDSLQDSAQIGAPLGIFDYSGYLEYLASQKHNFMRMWVYEGGGNLKYAEPLPYVRTGPGTGSDGKLRFDLRQLNQGYFDRLRARVMAAQDKGIYVSVMLFNGWGLYDNGHGNPWPLHPFNEANNINGINGDASGDAQKVVHTLRVPSITRLQEAYVEKVIDTLNDLDNVLYEIVNEDKATAENAAWQYHFIEYIHQSEREKAKQHPVGMTVQWPNGNNQVLYDSPADWISPNPDGGYAVNPPTAHHGKVVVTDTDHLFGTGGDFSWVWKSFLRGLNPIYMDPLHFLVHTQEDPAGAEAARTAMSYTRYLARRINLAAMVPHNELCSTTFCLADPQREYLVYLPFGSHWLGPWIEFLPYGIESWINSYLCCSVAVDLSVVSRELSVEWFSVSSGVTVSGGTISGGAKKRFVAPFSGDAVLHLSAR